MAQIIKYRGGRTRPRPLSAQALRLLRRLADLQRSQQRGSVPALELLQSASSRTADALLALDRRSLITKAADGGLRLTRGGWALLGGE